VTTARREQANVISGVDGKPCRASQTGGQRRRQRCQSIRDLIHVTSDQSGIAGRGRMTTEHGRRECDRVPPADGLAPGKREGRVHVGRLVGAYPGNSPDELEGVPACGQQVVQAFGAEEMLHGPFGVLHMATCLSHE
jgi:hypothetical protein